MERLTKWNVRIGRYTANEKGTQSTRNHLLGQYEETGLTPEQVQELKERDTAKAPEEFDGQWYKCPRCGKYAGRDLNGRIDNARDII